MEKSIIRTHMDLDNRLETRPKNSNQLVNGDFVTKSYHVQQQYQRFYITFRVFRWLCVCFSKFVGYLASAHTKRL